MTEEMISRALSDIREDVRDHNARLIRHMEQQMASQANLAAGLDRANKQIELSREELDRLARKVEEQSAAIDDWKVARKILLLIAGALGTVISGLVYIFWTKVLAWIRAVTGI